MEAELFIARYAFSKKTAHFHGHLFIKVKYVKISSISQSTESTQPLFYRLGLNRLKYN